MLSHFLSNFVQSKPLRELLKTYAISVVKVRRSSYGSSRCFVESRQSNYLPAVNLCKFVLGRKGSDLGRLVTGNARGFRSTAVLKEDVTIKAPRFPESVAEGDLRWSKKEGDPVHLDEVVCEIETDKTALPVPSPVSGTLLKRLVEDGATVKEMQPLYVVKAGAAPPTSALVKSQLPPAGPAKPPELPPVPQPSPSAPKPSPPTSPGSPQSAIPSLKRPPGKASDSVIVKVPPEDPTKEITGTRSEFRVPINKMRQRIGQRLKDAQNTYAMLTSFNEIDMSSIIAFRKGNQDAFANKYGIKLGFMSAFIKAAAYALQDQPVINAVIEKTEIMYRDFVDISVAVATPKGLVVPVLRNVEHMNYGDIEKGLILLAEKAKKGSLAVEDMAGGTFTITNGGVFGSLLSTPIINMPQSAILGMHATFDRPVAVKGKVEIRPMMYVALTYDHRLVDGREAVLFLRKIKAAVEDPRIIIAGI